MESTMRQRVTQIKEIVKDNELSISAIADLVSMSGEYVSEPTNRKILADEAENLSFQSHSIIAVYEALITKYGDQPDIKDVDALKMLIIEKDKQIDRIVMQAERTQEDFSRRSDIYADRKSVYENMIQLLREQLAIKDKEIDRQAALIEKLVGKLTE